jgi:hypothetical protein
VQSIKDYGEEFVSLGYSKGLFVSLIRRFTNRKVDKSKRKIWYKAMNLARERL